ncbi:MAG: hypothetical protein HXY21_02840 [Parvularculaceae bacterium]|nr:hypothetical protein [Parvularculaceae bacterium]
MVFRLATAAVLPVCLLLAACGESCFYPDKEETQFRSLRSDNIFSDSNEATIGLAFSTNRRARMRVYENIDESITLSDLDHDNPKWAVSKLEDHPPMILPARRGRLKEIVVDAQHPYVIEIPVTKSIGQDGEILLDFGVLGHAEIPAGVDEVSFRARFYPLHNCAFNDTPGYPSEDIVLRVR